MQNDPNGVEKLAAQLVVASDVHLRTLNDHRGTLLMDLLARLAETVEVVVLNGDIFDFCFGDSAYFRAKFQAFGELVRRTVERGIQVVFVEGNHEFHLDRIGWDHMTLVQGDHHVVRLSSGEVIKVGHGDLITGERLYKGFRATLKSNLARLVAARVPGSWLDTYALNHARFSRSQDVYRTIRHERILAAAERWLESGAFDHGIIGHFHVPYSEPRRLNQGFVMSVESWDRPNVLTYDNGVFGRIYLEEPGKPFIPTPATSIF